jgi:hypothetical protein
MIYSFNALWYTSSSDVQPSYRIVAVPPFDGIRIWRQDAESREFQSDNVELLLADYKVQHPTSSHIRFRRIIEHLIPVDHRILPVSDLVHAHYAQVFPRPGETNPYFLLLLLVKLLKFNGVIVILRHFIIGEALFMKFPVCKESTGFWLLLSKFVLSVSKTLLLNIATVDWMVFPTSTHKESVEEFVV